jgi:hypothetical protein
MYMNFIFRYNMTFLAVQNCLIADLIFSHFYLHDLVISSTNMSSCFEIN